MLNKIMDDKVFGNVEYNYSWIKKETVNFYDNNYEVTIIIKAYKDEDILDIQRNTYRNYLNTLESKKNVINDILADYCKNEFNQNISINKCLEPKSILFERNGSWGILFDSEFAIEEGVALYFQDNEISIGIQDDYL